MLPLFLWLNSHGHICIRGVPQNENFILTLLFRYYCRQEGLSKPEALCLPGYYCNGSSKVPNPSYAECPIGHYCPEGSYIPTPCPRGSFANSKRNRNVSDCKPCSPGYYCDPNATIVEERECDPGYVCILGEPFAPFTSMLNWSFLYYSKKPF